MEEALAVAVSDGIAATVPTTEVIGDLNKIDEHLAGLYRRTAGAEPGSAVPVVRALLHNLIVYACSEEEAEQAANDVSEIAGNHPCRAIIVEAIPPRPGEPPAIVTTVCGITERGDRVLCGEIVTIHATNAADVTGAVVPLLLPDVPVFLWDLGEIPEEDEVFDALVPVADHLLIDSRKFQDLRKGLGLVPRFCPHEGVQCTVTDLAWMSLLPWRELTAQHFDPPAHREYLYDLRRVDVIYARGERDDAPPSAALLIVSWLMERAGLEMESVEPSEGGATAISALQMGKRVEIRVSPTGRSLERGRLGAFVLHGGSQDRIATFVTKNVTMTELVISEDCPGVCLPPMELDLPTQAEAALAALALDRGTRDVIYERCVRIATRLLAERDRQGR